MARKECTRTSGGQDLADLPVEILSKIASSLDPYSLQALSRTCKPLNMFVLTQGWRAFVGRNYPQYTGQTLWRNAAHALTRQDAAWKTLALNGHVLLPDGDVGVHEHTYQSLDTDLGTSSSGRSAWSRTVASTPRSSNAHPYPPRQRQHGRGGQTMGFQPCMDAREDWVGGEWTDRRETLAIGAGCEILLRTRLVSSKNTELNSSLEYSVEQLSLNQNPESATHKGTQHPVWKSLRNPLYRDGLDDVTTLKLLPTQMVPSSGRLELIAGRASGILERLAYDTEACVVENVFSLSLAYNTSSQPVRSMDIVGPQTSDDARFAVGLGNTEIAVYDIHSRSPLSRISVDCGESSTCRTWTTKFLSRNKLAVGHGMNKSPLDVFCLRPEELGPDPLRRFKLDKGNAVYSVIPIADPASSAVAGGDVFVSGTYGGSVLLHDMRDRRDVVRTFVDGFEHGTAVYSLLSVQPHLILAGTSAHAKMCLFDLRQPLGQVANLYPHVSAGIPTSNNSRNAHRGRGRGRGRGHGSWRSYSSFSSSIYSLVRPGPYSPTFYAGLEDHVLQFDAYSATDRFPDPVFAVDDDQQQEQRRRGTELNGKKDNSSSIRRRYRQMIPLAAGYLRNRPVNRYDDSSSSSNRSNSNNNKNNNNGEDEDEDEDDKSDVEAEFVLLHQHQQVHGDAQTINGNELQGQQARDQAEAGARARAAVSPATELGLDSSWSYVV